MIRFDPDLDWEDPNASVSVPRPLNRCGPHMIMCPFTLGEHPSTHHHAATTGTARCMHSLKRKTRWIPTLLLWAQPSILSRAVQASITVTRGAGGLSISPKLTFSPIVPSNSPVFQVFTVASRIDGYYDVRTHLYTIVKTLERLFDKGKASPYDRDEQGDSLLHVDAAFLFGL